jgi:lysyl-tRNA synthetase class I
MKKTIYISLFLFLFIVLSSMTTHKFFVAIYQINHAKEKKMLQITSRLFIDDINEALEKKYHIKSCLASDKETPENIEFLKKYLSEKFIIKVNGQPKTIEFLSKETEDNVIICYSRIKEVGKINTLEIENSIIMENHGDQQNIIQATFNGSKHSLLLTSESFKGMLK